MPSIKKTVNSPQVSIQDKTKPIQEQKENDKSSGEKNLEDTDEIQKELDREVAAISSKNQKTATSDNLNNKLPTSQNAKTFSSQNSNPVNGKNIGDTNPNALMELTKADIFKLLGMYNIPETEKKKNLDEMEETIWADFVEEDLPGMLPESEKERYQDLLKTSPSAEKVINFFGSPPSGGLPANFEEKYLAKTLEFKAEIAKEQIATLLETVDDPAKKEILQKAKSAAEGGYWKQVEELMMNFG